MQYIDRSKITEETITRKQAPVIDADEQYENNKRLARNELLKRYPGMHLPQKPVMDADKIQTEVLTHRFKLRDLK